MDKSDKFEEKICVKCGEKTPHEVSTPGFYLTILIAFPFLLIGTVLIGPLGGLLTVAIYFMASQICKDVKFYKCDFCRTRYSKEKASRFIQEHNRKVRKANWEKRKNSGEST